MFCRRAPRLKCFVADLGEAARRLSKLLATAQLLVGGNLGVVGGCRDERSVS